MSQEMKGRRIPAPHDVHDVYALLKEAGDYCGPIPQPSGRPGHFGELVPAVWFLLPIARDSDAHGPARSLHSVESPPHVFTEEPDGSLTIRESIGAGLGGAYYWHGYLTNGNWELQKSKP